MFGPSLLQYVKDKKGNRRGVVFAVGKDCVGWSLCCKRDRFDVNFGVEIADGRATKGSSVPIPNIVRPYLEKMKDRANRYYK